MGKMVSKVAGNKSTALTTQKSNFSIMFLLENRRLESVLSALKNTILMCVCALLSCFCVYASWLVVFCVTVEIMIHMTPGPFFPASAMHFSLAEHVKYFFICLCMHVSWDSTFFYVLQARGD